MTRSAPVSTSVEQIAASAAASEPVVVLLMWAAERPCSRAKIKAAASALLLIATTAWASRRPASIAATMARMLAPLWEARKPSLSIAVRRRRQRSADDLSLGEELADLGVGAFNTVGAVHGVAREAFSVERADRAG